jgi:aspartyl-tRNA(Asn)/glutamyl-tRNA(Gln) amidotransferase subunit C
VKTLLKRSTQQQHISDAQVKHLAHISRLAIPDAKLSQYKADLENILTFVGHIGSVNTSTTPPLHSLLEFFPNKKLKERETKAENSEDILKNASTRFRNYFVVPKRDTFERENDERNGLSEGGNQ